jgi:hypothetical protein
MVLFVLLGLFGVLALRLRAAEAGPAARSYRLYMPLQFYRPPPTPTPVATPDPCRASTGESYALIPLESLSLDPGVPASAHPDMNLSMRGYREVVQPYKGLVDYNGEYDWQAPRLYTLFADQTWRGISRVYQVYQWDGGWSGMAFVNPITSPDVTLIGLNSRTGETVHVPYRPADIYQGNYVALVLYADRDRITLKYTREDHVVNGYTLHIEAFCVDPNLLALYNQVSAAGRSSVPGIRFGQALGRATGNEVKIAIRDRGTFMDPRARKDWWQGLTMSAGTAVPLLDASGEAWYEAQQSSLAEPSE